MQCFENYQKRQIWLNDQFKDDFDESKAILRSNLFLFVKKVFKRNV